MKKTFLSVFSAVWLLLLAGCGTSDSGPAQDTSSQTADIGNNRAAEIALADAGFTEDELHVFTSPEMRTTAWFIMK